MIQPESPVTGQANGQRLGSQTGDEDVHAKVARRV